MISISSANVPVPIFSTTTVDREWLPARITVRDASGSPLPDVRPRKIGSATTRSAGIESTETLDEASRTRATTRSSLWECAGVSRAGWVT